MRIKILTALLFLVSITYISCNDSGRQESGTENNQNCLTDQQKAILSDDSLINELFEDTFSFDETYKKNAALAGKPPYTGSVVKYKDAKPCIDLYKTTMALYGIDERKPSPTNVTISKTLQITYDEFFRGKELKKFLRQAARKRKMLFGSNKHLSIAITFGICTHDFATEYDPSREGRICIFLVTRTWDDGTKQWLLDDPDDDTFDFGGIHP
jgi:hypothetical protein